MRLLTALSVATLAAGCGGPGGASVDPALATAVGPHGGPALPLPGGKGYAEIVVEPAQAATKSGRQVVLAVYFLRSDLKAALTPPPTEVAATVTTPAKPEPTPVSLAPKPIKSDPIAAARFASAVGPYDFDELRGELSGTVDGQPFTRAFAFR